MTPDGITPDGMTLDGMTPDEIAEDTTGNIMETRITSTQRKSAHISAARPKEILLRTQLPSRSDNQNSLTPAAICLNFGVACSRYHVCLH